MNRRLMIEIGAVTIVAALGFGDAWFTYLGNEPVPFYQHEFGPAVMFAAGHGFVNPEVAPGSALEQFLQVRAPAIDPASVRPDAIRELSQFQHAHRYLITTVGLWWRVTSVSWARIAEFAGALHVMGIIATYALIRLFTPAAPAIAGAALFALSPLQVSFALMPRDLSKGPFVLAVVPLVVAIVLRPMPLRRLAALAAAAGALIGIGQGFKMDVAIMAPIAIVCIVLFHGARPWTAIRAKAICVGALILALTITAWPTVSKLSSGGSNAWHVVLLGYSDWFDPGLGIEPAPYTFSPFYSDVYLRNMLRARHMALTGADAPMPSAEYDAAAFALWREWVLMFPGDVYTRLLGAADGVLNLAFTHAPMTGGLSPPSAALAPVYRGLEGLRGWGFAVGALAVVLAAGVNARTAAFVALLLIALAGYPSLQFDRRHFAHLQGISLAMVTVVVWSLLAGLASWLRASRRLPDAVTSGVMARALAAGAVVLIVITAAPVAVLRAYQTSRVTGAVNDFLQQPRDPLAVTFLPLSSSRWLAQWPETDGAATGVPGLRAAYYVAEFRAEGPNEPQAIGLRYRSGPERTTCSFVRRLLTTAGTARFAFPVYAVDGESGFDGIEIGSEMKRRLTGVFRTAHGPGGLPMEARLSAAWQDQRQYQRLGREHRSSPDAIGFNVISPLGDTCGADLPLLDAVLGDATRIDRAIDAPVQLAARELAAGDALVVKTWLDRGAIAAGLAQNGTFKSFVSIERPGASVAVIRVPYAGSFAVLIAGGDGSPRFSIDRLGIVSSERPLPVSQP